MRARSRRTRTASRPSAQLFTLKQTNRFEVEKQNATTKSASSRVFSTPGKGARRPCWDWNSGCATSRTSATQTGGAFQPPAQVLLALGSAYFRNGDRDAAEAQWLAAIDANPKLGEAHNNIAVIYMQTGRFEQALQELTLAEKAGFKVNPQFKADLKERAKTKR